MEAFISTILVKHALRTATFTVLLLGLVAMVPASAQECTATPIISPLDALNAGVAWDIWNNNYMIAGNNDKSGNDSAQIDMIQNKITADFHNIDGATALSQVSGCNVEVQSLLARYKAFFRPGDPSYSAALGWATSVEVVLGTLSTQALARIDDPYTLSLIGGRYKVTSHWKNQYAGGAQATLSKARITDYTGAFWIADASTYEYMIRIQAGQSNGRSWIAIPTFTDVEFWITVTDTVNGQSKEYHSEPGNKTLIYDPFFFVYP